MYDQQHDQDRVENEKNQEMFKVLNGNQAAAGAKELKIISTQRDAVKIQGFYLNDQIHFLYKNNAIAKQQPDNCFELKLT